MDKIWFVKINWFGTPGNRTPPIKKVHMEKILMFLLIAYGISVAIFGLYYNYEYAQTHGFLAWLFFGEIIATLKSFVWPLFEFDII